MILAYQRVCRTACSQSNMYIRCCPCSLCLVTVTKLCSVFVSHSSQNKDPITPPPLLLLLLRTLALPLPPSLFLPRSLTPPIM